jgi:hypothetical protein
MTGILLLHSQPHRTSPWLAECLPMLCMSETTYSILLWMFLSTCCVTVWYCSGAGIMGFLLTCLLRIAGLVVVAGETLYKFAPRMMSASWSPRALHGPFRSPFQWSKTSPSSPSTAPAPEKRRGRGPVRTLPGLKNRYHDLYFSDGRSLNA